MKVVVYNLGCKVNQYESDGMIHALYELGYEVSADLEYADAFVLNTCAVTNEAEKKSRQAVARCLKLNPNAKVLVCGCASQNDSNQFYKKDGVSYVSGIAGKGKLPQMLQEEGIFVTEIARDYEDDLTPSVVRTRSYIKIQDGCDNFCSYCIIPYLRGRSRSRSMASVVAEFESLSAVSKEIVVTGIDMSSYGKDIGESLGSMLNAISHVDCRVRLGSLEVRIITKEFLESTKLLKAFCPHFHLSLQSGCDKTLCDMNRHYTTAEYAEKVKLIREYYPNANITTDVIVGYPTESETDFANTLDFVSTIGFGDVHAFAYSSRNGTKAEKLGTLDKSVVHVRLAKLSKIIDASKVNYESKFIGECVEVLVENTGGYTREYVRVELKSNDEQNSIVSRVPISVNRKGLSV